MLRNTVLALLVAAEASQAAFTLRKTYDSSNFLDSFNFRDVRRDPFGYSSNNADIM